MLVWGLPSERYDSVFFSEEIGVSQNEGENNTHILDNCLINNILSRNKTKLKLKWDYLLIHLFYSEMIRNLF